MSSNWLFSLILIRRTKLKDISIMSQDKEKLQLLTIEKLCYSIGWLNISFGNFPALLWQFPSCLLGTRHGSVWFAHCTEDRVSRSLSVVCITHTRNTFNICVKATRNTVHIKLWQNEQDIISHLRIVLQQVRETVRGNERRGFQGSRCSLTLWSTIHQNILCLCHWLSLCQTPSGPQMSGRLHFITEARSCKTPPHLQLC